ncbi:MAG TPA: HDOD domain-containing protein [Bryobacteraceae bacterium]|nr:HDOD domain-containing protein [Bryobacteraceae bacterium]
MITPVESGTTRSQDLKAKALDALASLPPFSPILTRLLASLTGEDVPFAKLADLIEKDAVLTGNLLNIVNSALYARRATINSVRHAISILGINKLRNAVLVMSISRMWSKAPMPGSWSMTRFNKHSAATGMLSDMMAQHLPVHYAEGAFVAGLLHDLGQMLVALRLREQHDEILRLRLVGDRTGVECEREVLGFGHPELSAEALATWNLPLPILAAVRYHHTPETDDSRIDARQIALSRIVQAANNYVNSISVSIYATGVSDSADATLIESLFPDEDRRTRLLEEFKTEYDVMLQFFR